jgi:hypothetical protein
MNISKKTRNKIYVRALFKYKERLEVHPKIYLFGLCRALTIACESLRINSALYSSSKKEENFPEVFKHKPKRMYDEYWFGRTTKIGIQKRINILNQAIKETES